MHKYITMHGSPNIKNTGMDLRDFYTDFGGVHPPRIQNLCEIRDWYWKQDFILSCSLIKNLNSLNEEK